MRPGTGGCAKSFLLLTKLFPDAYHALMWAKTNWVLICGFLFVADEFTVYGGITGVVMSGTFQTPVSLRRDL